MKKKIFLSLLAMVFALSSFAWADPYEAHEHNWRNDNTFNHETTFKGDITLREGTVATEIAGTNETVSMSLPFSFYEEFCSNATFPNGDDTLSADYERGLIWAITDTGTVNATAQDSQPGGMFKLELCATSEKQESTLYWNDNRILDMSKGLIWEARIKLAVLPSGIARAYWGLAGDEAEEASTTTYHALFKVNGNSSDSSGSNYSSVNCTTDDSKDITNATTGKTILATEWNTYKIDCTNKDNVKFFVNNRRVAASTSFNATGTGANCVLQPYFSVYKASGGDNATMYIDYMRAWQKRQP